MVKRFAIVAAVAALAGCSGIGGGGGFGGRYSLVRPAQVVKVGSGAMTVVAPREWNRADRTIFTDVRWVEDWTLNGPYLDSISFVAGLPDNHRLLREDYKADRQVPRFRSNVTAPEVVGMIESLYRVAGGRAISARLHWSRAPSSAPPASSSTTNISTATNYGARAARSARWSTAAST